MVVDAFGLTGSVIEGQFRVDRVVGEGGFSVVYLGHHLGLDEPVAIKVLKLLPSVEPEMLRSFQDRFRDESRIAYRLSRGNLDIVRSITAGTTQAPAFGKLVPYMVLEWLEGKSLGADFRERRKKGLTGRTLEETVALFDPAVMAIAYAHAQGVVHRDLKPGNLFLTNTQHGQRLKVLDFGLAKIVDPTDDEGIGIVPSAKTVGTHTICSPSYGAPEQFDSKIGKMGPWTDVYALGLLLLESLRDKKVRTSEGIAMCAIEALDPNRQPSPHALGIKVPPQVEVVVARALALDPKTRPEDAGVLWGLLKNSLRRNSGPTPVALPQDGATLVDPRVYETSGGKYTLEELAALETTLQTEGSPGDAPPRSSAAPMDLGGTLIMADAPPRPSGGQAAAGSANGPTSAPASASRSGPVTTRKKKKGSRAPLVLGILLLLITVFVGGAYAAYRFVLAPRGVTLPFHF